ncbi:MAG: hypothetical protein Q9184_002613 [Pyrenodesmia sp. 2 TL-2023]
MASNGNTIIAFDLYGTLLSTESIAKELAKHFGEEKASAVAATWRKYQLEYTWRLNSMNQYLPFSTITQRSLNHTLWEYNLSLPSEEAVSSLMSAYDSLSTFPDVGPALESLGDQTAITPVIFTNGTQAMVSNSVNCSPDLSPYSKIFKDIITVEEVKKFKPHPDVYFHLAKKTGKGKEQMSEMWLVSGNPFDVVGAKAVGMKAVWVDRGGAGWVDGLIEGKEGRPDLVVRKLGEVAEAGLILVRNYSCNSTTANQPHTITMSAPTNTPDYVFASPLGFHAKNVGEFFSQYPTPMSSDPDRRQWATQDSHQSISNMFLSAGNTPGAVVMTNLFIINKSRDVDRICPSCRRIYRVGEGPRAYASFEEFMNRPRGGSEVGEKTKEEQDLSGACCGPCFNTLSELDWDENECGGELATFLDLAAKNGFVFRRSRPEEEYETGVKIIWEKKGGGVQA